MSLFVTIGRILFALFFIVAGAFTLADIPEAAKELSPRISIPAIVQPYATDLETKLSISTPALIAIVVGTVAVVSGLMIAFNLGVRLFSFLLIVGLLLATMYFDDFWTTTGREFADNLSHALKNAALIGALLMLFGYGSGRTATHAIEDPPYHDR